jgi:hypothetical protein
MFGSHKKLYKDGAQTEGVVIKCSWGSSQIEQFVTVRVKFPDGSTTDIKKSALYTNDVGVLYEGTVVPIRYDPSDQSKVALDVPALLARHEQAKAAQQVQLDAEVAAIGQPGAQAPGGTPVQVISGLGDLGNLKAEILQAAAQNPGAVIDLRSSAQQTSPPGTGPAPDLAGRLEKLAALKQQGLLSDAQFEAAKAKILSES